MELEDVWEPGLPLAPGTLGQDDEQQLLWGFPEILWTAGAALAFILDLNTRLFVYLKTLYPNSNDLTEMTAKRLAAMSQTDYDGRLRQLIRDATP